MVDRGLYSWTVVSVHEGFLLSPKAIAVPVMLVVSCIFVQHCYILELFLRCGYTSYVKMKYYY